MSVVVYYQSDGGEEAHYPSEGSVPAKRRGVIINGKFYVKATYKVWLKVFEGGLTVSFQQAKPRNAAVGIGLSFSTLHRSNNIIARFINYCQTC